MLTFQLRRNFAIDQHLNVFDLLTEKREHTEAHAAIAVIVQPSAQVINHCAGLSVVDFPRDSDGRVLYFLDEERGSKTSVVRSVPDGTKDAAVELFVREADDLRAAAEVLV